MSIPAAPIYIGTLNGKPLRFFRAPFAEPHLPWHVPDDLHHCLGMPRDLRQHYQRMLQSPEWSADIRTVVCGDEIVNIGPHYMAQGLIAAVIEFGRATSAVELAYAEAGGEALKVLAGDLLPDAALSFMTLAFQNTHGLAGVGGAA